MKIERVSQLAAVRGVLSGAASNNSRYCTGRYLASASDDRQWECRGGCEAVELLNVLIRRGAHLS
jgi:hypothetical protein